MEAEADWRKHHNAILKSALHRIMAEVALRDDDREPNIDFIFDIARKAIEEVS
jgi:hypothetical protein